MMGEILEVQREEHDRQAMQLLKSGMIVGLIVVGNSQLEFSLSLVFSLIIRGNERSTSNSSYHHGFSPDNWR